MTLNCLNGIYNSENLVIFKFDRLGILKILRCIQMHQNCQIFARRQSTQVLSLPSLNHRFCLFFFVSKKDRENKYIIIFLDIRTCFFF